MIRWMWAFVDRPIERFDESAAFWTAVTDTRLSPRRGDLGEFATLLPAEGDACLKLQGVHGGGGAHLDLEFEDYRAAVRTAQDLGAAVVSAEEDEDLTVLRSPSGQAFCVTGWHGATRRPPAASSRLDQVCVDLAPAAFDAEIAFWSALAGWEVRQGRFEEFSYLVSPPELPIRILFQRLDDDRPTSCHLDFACSDVAATRARHELHGAHFVADGKSWTVMADPTGALYCLTQRSPVTGTLPPAD